MTYAEVVGGVPVLSVEGTPRAIGEAVGTRMKPRLQVLAQYLLEQLAVAMRPDGGRLEAQDIRTALRPSLEIAQRLEPGLWMEIESMAAASGLPPEDLLLIHGWGDLFGFFAKSAPPSRSTYLAMAAGQTASKRPLAALAWHLDPALLPYVTLVRRQPAHGPVSLILTLAGLHPVAGLSEAGIAAATNELRVKDGAAGHLTAHLLASALTAPTKADAEERLRAHPRHGGAAVHLLSADGSRCTLELSGQAEARLPDPLPSAPRVHANLAVSGTIAKLAGGQPDATSRPRLTRLAALAVAATATDPKEIAVWFRLGLPSESTNSAPPDGILPHGTVLLVADPGKQVVHLQRGGTSAKLESIGI